MLGVTNVDDLPIASEFDKEPTEIDFTKQPLKVPPVPFPRPSAPYDVSTAPPVARPTNSCTFDGCPAGPYLYLLTSHRNRGAHYNLWVRTA